MDDDIGDWIARNIAPGATLQAAFLSGPISDNELKRLVDLRQQFAGMVLQTDMMIGRHILQKLEKRISE